MATVDRYSLFNLFNYLLISLIKDDLFEVYPIYVLKVPRSFFKLHTNVNHTINRPPKSPTLPEKKKKKKQENINPM
jgi:hypothetical protein